MIYKKLSLLILFFATGLLTASAQKSPQDMDRFIDALMKKMTTEEKIGQLNLPVTGEITTGQAKSSDIAGKIKKGEVEKIREVQKQAVEESRLGIPLLFGMDVIHGYETMFPIPLGLSCTWDMAAIEESARIAAVEASADGISWTFSPMVDISRDPRWGRNDEIMACVKHFALYGASEAGRDYNTVDMSRQRMFNDYMLPYEAAVEAGVGSVMASFNEVDGIPATANKWLMTDILRGQWGFNGFVVTDYTGISEMIDHGIGDLQTGSIIEFLSGIRQVHACRRHRAIVRPEIYSGDIANFMSQIDCDTGRNIQYPETSFEHTFPTALSKFIFFRQGFITAPFCLSHTKRSIIAFKRVPTGYRIHY